MVDFDGLIILGVPFGGSLSVDRTLDDFTTKYKLTTENYLPLYLHPLLSYKFIPNAYKPKYLFNSSIIVVITLQNLPVPMLTQL
jgi:hypothetical protein